MFLQRKMILMVTRLLVAGVFRTIFVEVEQGQVGMDYSALDEGGTVQGRG